MALVLSATSPAAVDAQASSKKKVTPVHVTPSQSKVIVAAPRAQMEGFLDELILRLGEPANLTTKERKLMNKVVVAVRKGDPSAADGPWKALVESQARRRGSAVDVNVLVQLVLREAYLETSDGLRHRADKVSSFNQMKKQLREHLSDLRRERSELDDEGDTVTVQTVTLVRKGKTHRLVQGRKTVMTRAQLIEYTGTVEEMLESVSDDAQLANLELQDALQKQQQAFQTLIQIMKSQHDTAKAIIRSIR